MNGLKALRLKNEIIALKKIKNFIFLNLNV